jgi:hypothetical protein
MCRLTGMDLFQASSLCSPLLLVAVAVCLPTRDSGSFPAATRASPGGRSRICADNQPERPSRLPRTARPETQRLRNCRPILLKLDHLVENHYSLWISHNPQNTQISLTISAQYARKKTGRLKTGAKFRRRWNIHPRMRTRQSSYVRFSRGLDLEGDSFGGELLVVRHAAKPSECDRGTEIKEFNRGQSCVRPRSLCGKSHL